MLCLALPWAGCGGDDPESERAPTSAEKGTEESAGTRPPGPERTQQPRERPLLPLERVIFFGDSLGTTGSSEPYPSLLGGPLGPRGGQAEVINLSEPGTATEDWLPGTPLFESTLSPALDGADAVFVTLGGNDLERALGGIDGIDALGAAAQDGGAETVERARKRIGRNLGRIISAVRAGAPEAAVIFVGYPDYSAATIWRETAGVAGSLALRAGLAELERTAGDSGPDLVISLLESSAATGVDSLLADAEHLGPEGHAFYADQIRRSLAEAPAP